VKFLFHDLTPSASHLPAPDDSIQTLGNFVDGSLYRTWPRHDKTRISAAWGPIPVAAGMKTPQVFA
jgi:hypothetical protein